MGNSTPSSFPQSDNLNLSNVAQKPIDVASSNLTTKQNPISNPSTIENIESNNQSPSISGMAIVNSIFAGFSGMIYYPLLRRCIEKKMITYTPGYKIEELKTFAKGIKEKGGHFGGFKSYLASKYLPFFLISLTSFNTYLNFIAIPVGLAISYPLYVNSNLQALKLPGYASLKNRREMLLLFLQQSSYKGLSYYIFSEILMFIPFLNYLSHRFETIRLAYVFGPYFGHEFNSYKDAKLYLRANKGFKPGRFHYNISSHLFNFFVFIRLGSEMTEQMKIEN